MLVCQCKAVLRTEGWVLFVDLPRRQPVTNYRLILRCSPFAHACSAERTACRGAREHPPCPGHSVARCRTRSWGRNVEVNSGHHSYNSVLCTAWPGSGSGLLQDSKSLAELDPEDVCRVTAGSPFGLIYNLPSPRGGIEMGRLRYSDMIATCGVGHFWFAERLKAFREAIQVRLACSAFPWHLPYGILRYGILFLHLATGR
ncbi:hypothetical protein EDB86DRAFT_649466 [Lactarius hatsudake]|nr:hypothetical protein EDB86DRAFT_649466 [Lactarius hatsudake]